MGLYGSGAGGKCYAPGRTFRWLLAPEEFVTSEADFCDLQYIAQLAACLMLE